MGRLYAASLGAAIALCGISSIALAQAAPPAESVATVQTVPPDVVVYSAPPAGFNPLLASDTALAKHGFPPRPDQNGAPQVYAHWQKLVMGAKKRVSNLKLQQTNIHNGPLQGWSEGPAQNASERNAPANSIAVNATNWSGYAVTAANGTFSNNNSQVFAEWVVPIAKQAFGVCDGGWDYSSQWVGFDGAANSNDVLQAGTEADAYCSGGARAMFYSAWYEWSPFAETRISLPVYKGNLIGTVVWYTTTSPFGHAYIVNYTTQQAAAIGFNPPLGTNYLGNSVQWVIERPEVNGALANLTNYIADQFNFEFAFNGSYFYPGSSPAGTTMYDITMVCPPWSPSSSCPTSNTAISVPQLYGTFTMWFYPEGLAY